MRFSGSWGEKGVWKACMRGTETHSRVCCDILLSLFLHGYKFRQAQPMTDNKRSQGKFWRCVTVQLLQAIGFGHSLVCAHFD
jgi:hypothetical protein